jgi:hypothetical protein
MWLKPSYTPDRPSPPAETGERLATFDRGEGQELRVTLAEFNGHPFISLRVWEKGRDGRMWPQKAKGCSIRMGEISELAEVLSRVAGEQPPRGDRRDDRRALTGPDRGRPERRAWTPPKSSPVAATADASFDEFDPK